MFPEEEFIYKIITAMDYEQALKDGVFRHQSLVEEGFIHFAFHHQLSNVYLKHFKGQKDLRIIKVNPNRLIAALKIEDLKNKGETFPHLYGELNWDAVEEVESEHTFNSRNKMI